MGLRELPAAVAEGFGGKRMVLGDAGPPVHSVLDDVVPQPARVDPSSVGVPAGGETATAGSPSINRVLLPARRSVGMRGLRRQRRCRARATRGACASCFSGKVLCQTMVQVNAQVLGQATGCLTRCKRPPLRMRRWCGTGRITLTESGGQGRRLRTDRRGSQSSGMGGAA